MCQRVTENFRNRFQQFTAIDGHHLLISLQEVITLWILYIDSNRITNNCRSNVLFSLEPKILTLEYLCLEPFKLENLICLSEFYKIWTKISMYKTLIKRKKSFLQAKIQPKLPKKTRNKLILFFSLYVFISHLFLKHKSCFKHGFSTSHSFRSHFESITRVLSYFVKKSSLRENRSEIYMKTLYCKHTSQLTLP